MCKISRKSEAGKIIAGIKLHPNFLGRQEEFKHDCASRIVPIGKIILTDKTNKTDYLYACIVCGAPMNPKGFMDHLCGPTGRVQRVLFNGGSAKIDLNPDGEKLGFTGGTFDAKIITNPVEQTI